MEILSENGVFASWLLDYGSFVLFLLLIAGIVAFPVPEETLLVISGIFMQIGHMNVPSTLVAAYAGSISGITISYLLGRTLGHYFIHKYGSWVGMTETRLNHVHTWFEKYGTWMLFIGYFIPGVRHFTGFLAGSTRLEFKTFALFAYLGAIVWVSVFLGVGYFFGNYLHLLSGGIEFNMEVIASILLTILIIYLVFFFERRAKNRKKATSERVVKANNLSRDEV